jgi:hypothetical protein
MGSYPLQVSCFARLPLPGPFTVDSRLFLEIFCLAFGSSWPFGHRVLVVSLSSPSLQIWEAFFSFLYFYIEYIILKVSISISIPDILNVSSLRTQIQVLF